MAAKRPKKVVTTKPVEVKKESNQLEILPGNIGVLTIRFLAAINQQLSDIKDLLKAKNE